MTEFQKDLSSYRQTLAISENGSRLILSGSAQRLPLPPSSQAVINAPVNSVAFAQMQQLRNMSGTQIPATRPMPIRRSKLINMKWVIIGAVGATALIVTLYLLSDNSSEPVVNQPSTNTTTDPNVGNPTPVIESLSDLMRGLRSNNPKDRDAAVQKLSDRKDAEAIEALTHLMIGEEWPDEAGQQHEVRDAALLALMGIDADKAPAILRRAAKVEDFRTRIWAYCELAKRIDSENRPVLQPSFLAGLKDANPQVRRAVAYQIHKCQLNDPGVVQALVARVSDDVWGEVNNSPPENFIHNPKADGGKDAALNALEEFAPKRVLEALNAATKCGNLDVKKWAEHQKKNRDLN